MKSNKHNTLVTPFLFKIVILPSVFICLVIIGSLFIIKNQQITIDILIISAIVYVFFSVWLTSYLSKQIHKIGRYIPKWEFDNTIELENMAGTNESVFSSLESASKNMEVFIRKLKEGITNADGNSDELSATMTELIYIMQEIKETMNVMTSGSMELSATTQQISASIEDIDSSTKILANKANEGGQLAKEIKERASQVSKD